MLVFTRFSGGDFVVACFIVDVLFDVWVANGVVDGVVDVNGGDCVGPVATVELVFVGVLAATCLFAVFAVLGSGGWLEEEASA